MLAENDIFGGLPHEAKAVMLLEMSLRDIQALTMASPAMLRYFRDREMSILKPHLNYIMEHYGHRNAIAQVIMTIRFRRVREKLRGKSASEVEEGITPILESIRGKHPFKHTRYAQDPGLSVLSAVMSLIPELIQAFRDWQLVAMELKPCKEGFRCQERNVPLQEIPAAEKWKLIESFLRYDWFCNINHHPDLLLFQRECSVRVRRCLRTPFYAKDFRRLKATSNNCRNNRLFDFRPFEFFTYLFKKRVQDARSYLHRRPYHSASQGPSKRRRVNKSSRVGAEQVEGEKVSDIRGFVKMKPVERDYFCDRLAIQGNRLKILLENLNQDSRARYLVKEFSKAVLVVQNDKKVYKSDSNSFPAARKCWR